MQADVNAIPESIEALTHRIFTTGRITRADENLLLRATRSATTLNHEEYNLVRQMQVRLQMGLLKVVD
ncbi:hypothetical protein H6F67_08730 [Microcoleus sp. FACHB-1515]|uniref:hypothetical protein n=1 Tax=Cyanophyceae TaxID=3028117 RepID=UPI001683B1AF|nr:hypothetical protein [Microcoleus sp. FACHB-1515]MBD2089937.1 hypothetical protein [Microcoleus sp. FACHB-1515]